MMTEIFAQGDLLIERVPDVAPSGTPALGINENRAAYVDVGNGAALA